MSKLKLNVTYCNVLQQITYFLFLLVAVVYIQGTRDVRNLSSPVEVIFHVDDRILKAIDTAHTDHQKAVGY